MKNLVFIICSILSLQFVISWDVSAQFTSWEKDVLYNNISFKKIHFKINGEDTLIIEGYLNDKAIIDGYPCYKFVVFTKGWNLFSFTLAEDHQMIKGVFPKDSKVSFNKDCISCFLGVDAISQGYGCKGNYAKWYSMGISTSFYNNGQLKNFFPTDKMIEVDGIQCKSSPFTNVLLYENGKLQECKLAVTQTIQGKDYKKKTLLVFDETGGVISAE